MTTDERSDGLRPPSLAKFLQKRGVEWNVSFIVDERSDGLRPPSLPVFVSAKDATILLVSYVGIR